MDIVYAKDNAVVGQVAVVKGSHWPADDPIVQGQPSLFSTDARYGLRFSTLPAGMDAPIEPAPIEQATAAPGERRNRRD